MSCVTFVGPLLAVCFSRAPALFNSKPTLMLLELATPLTVALFLPIVFFLVAPSLLGKLRSRLQRGYLALMVT
jgi:hypothetical protein